jgi:16S rRNA (guanine527-N7)-methyltransferase
MLDKLTFNAKSMGVCVSEIQAQQLIEYLKLIVKWNKVYNLSAIRSLEDGLDKHLLDSLSILPHIGSENLLDIGSGAGLPGVVIAIMRPDLNVSVLDTVGKKCHFMRFVRSQLGLKNLCVVNQRVEDYQSACFGQITSRAFAQFEKTLNLSRHLLCDNGRYLLMKGVNFSKENLPKHALIHALNVPNVSDKRFLIEINKE